VVGTAPEFRICGWMKGMDMKQDKYAKNPHGRSPAFFVPQKDLKGF